MNAIVTASKAVLWGVLALAVTTVTGCGSENKASESANVGTVTIPLQAQVNGTNYRLEAVFEITGPQGVTTLTTTPDQPVLTTTLPTGQYTAVLESFTLFKDDGSGTFNAVEATVESNTQNFTIADHSTTTISFQFDTDGVIVPVGSGNVDITFGVTDTSCTPIVVNTTQRTVQSERFFLDFSNAVASNPEDVDVLQWAGGGNLAPSFAVDACSSNIVEHFGNSWVPPDPNSGGHVLVGSGSTGSWEQDGASIVIHSTSSGCTASTTVPVETRYQFRQGIGRDTIEVERQFDFSGSPLGQFQSFRPFMPRLTVAFDRVLHPDATGTVLRTENVFACPYGCLLSDWDGSWFAYYASSGPLAGQGMIVLRESSSTSARLWLDNDAGTTNTNSSSVILSPPAGGFAQKTTEKELLCFFDADSWGSAGQAALALPPGCRPDLACNADTTTHATNEQKLPLDEVPSADKLVSSVAVTEDRY